MNYEMTIGLEVHAELNTATKIYCSCKNAFGAEVNSNCCPICTGMPGTLPTLNENLPVKICKKFKDKRPNFLPERNEHRNQRADVEGNGGKNSLVPRNACEVLEKGKMSRA